MVRPGREPLSGTGEIDDPYGGGKEEGERQTEDKALITMAAQIDGGNIGQIRLRRLWALQQTTWQGCLAVAVEPGSTVRTGGLPAYQGLSGTLHDGGIPRRQSDPKPHLLPRAHQVRSLLKRGLRGSPQGAIAHEDLDDDLNDSPSGATEGPSASRGKLFSRRVEQAVRVEPAPFPRILPPFLGVYR